MTGVEITIAVLLAITWIALAVISVYLWIRTRDLRTSIDNNLMIVEAGDRDIRRDMELDRQISLARLDRIDARIIDLEPRRILTEKTNKEAEEPIRQFATSVGFRSFIEGNTPKQ